MIPLVRQVTVRNFKSIGASSVTLLPLTALVGLNGSGKSNFVDALAFVRDSLAGSVADAFRERGGVSAVLRRSGDRTPGLGLRLQVSLPNGCEADYAFEIAAAPDQAFRVDRERCRIRGSGSNDDTVFEVRDGVFTVPIAGIRPRLAADRLALFAASGTEEFQPLYDFLTAMRFYSIEPSELRKLQDPDPGHVLRSDGGNAAAVLGHLWTDPERHGRVCRLLANAVEGIESVEPETVGDRVRLLFRQDIGLREPAAFDARAMSDGTLRLLGVLLAVYQRGRVSLVAIEEPEATIHPAASELLLEVLRDAASERQILITTHSPDILDSKELEEGQLRVVYRTSGGTRIAPPGRASRRAIREHLYTAGELLRVDELEGDVEAAEASCRTASLFDEAPGPGRALETENVTG